MVFISNSKRYLQMSSALSKAGNEYEMIGTSNVTSTSGNFDYTLNYASLIDESADIIDNSFIMLLKALSEVGVSKVAAAGFDGYQEDKLNFVNPDMEYTFIKDRTKELNEYARRKIEELSDKLSVRFVTSSLYE